MPKHIARLLLLFVGFIAVAIAVRYYLTDKSFYEYGHYRGDAVPEIARDKPKYQGTAYCESCHAAQFAEWSKGIHNSVEHRQGRQMRGLPRPGRQPRPSATLYQRSDRPGSPQQPEA